MIENTRKHTKKIWDLGDERNNVSLNKPSSFNMNIIGKIVT